jgi:hypothetical protein
MAAKGLAARFEQLRKRGNPGTDQPWAERVERIGAEDAGGVAEGGAGDPAGTQVPDLEFIDVVKAAVASNRGRPPAPAPEDLDVAALARDVADQQAVEPRVARVSVASTAWNALASDSVGKGLRRSGTPERDRLLFEAALLEPTHLTPILMTGAAALALRTGELEPWRTRAESPYHDHRAIPGLEKAGVMIGLGFTGPGSSRSEQNADGWFTLDGVDLIVHAHLYDALVVRIPDATGGASCFLLPIHSDPGVANGITVTRLFGRPGTAPGAFAEVRIDGARAMRVGPEGVADELLRPAIDRLRCDATMVGAAQMRAAVDALSDGLERRRGADVFHRLVASDIEASVSAGMAAEASRRISAKAANARLTLVLAQHWVRSRFDAVVPDAAAVMRLADMEVSPALAWTSPLLPLWGGTRTVLRADFARLVDRGEVEEAVISWGVGPARTPLAAAVEWLKDVALDGSAPMGDRLEAAALVWAVSLLDGQGRSDAAGTLLGAEAVPMRRGPVAGGEHVRERRPEPVEKTPADPTLTIDLREVFDAGATSGREGRPLHGS